MLLPERDGERGAAEAHAAGCARCAHKLAESARLVALVDALPPPPTPSAASLERARAALFAEAGFAVPTGARPWWALVLAAMVVAAFWGLAGGEALVPFGGGPGIVLAPEALLVAALATLVLAVVARAPGPAVAAAITASAVAAMLGHHGDGLGASAGLHCVTLELVVGVLPAAVVTGLFWRRGAAAGPSSRVRWVVAAAGAAGALAAQASLVAHCQPQGLGHGLVFHLGGVIVAALVGAAIASRLGHGTSAAG
jgi:hypothetical protein